MKKVYRGRVYESEPMPMEMAEMPQIGHYRGHACRFSYPRHLDVPQTVQNLQYRGAIYNRNASGELEAIASPTVQPPVQEPIFQAPLEVPPAMQSRRAMLAEAGRVHRASILNSLQRRMEIAKASGDNSLLHQLEEEMKQFA
jgi:hypothetical protein